MDGSPIVVALLAAGLAAGGCATRPPQESAVDVLRDLQEAFELHDVDAMLQHVTDDIQWLRVDGASLTVEAEGRDALGRAMRSYFASTNVVQSVAEQAVVNGDFVSVRERVTWVTEGVERSQTALAVYEVRGGQVRRVWYFPVS